MPKILTIKERPKTDHPLIEIMGKIDIGKTPIAKLVAQRLGATFISFPILDPYTMTGRALLSALSCTPRGLENKPEWWAHIYAANMYEQQEAILDALVNGPVVVINYILAYRIWMKATGIDMHTFLKGFTINLPDPTVGYTLIGDSIPTVDKPKFDFSPEFMLRIQRGINHPADSRVFKVALNDNKFTHIIVNEAATTITNHIRSRYRCKVNETELYTADYFPKKKDFK